MRKPIQIALIIGTALLWIALAFLIVRQWHLLDVADPMRDTGISFGYGFLIQFAAPAMLVLTVLVVCLLGVMERGSRQRLNELESSLSSHDRINRL
jgi:hypothetical protein